MPTEKGRQKKFTQREKDFVYWCCVLGDVAEAGRRAGYAESYVRTGLYNLYHSNKIQRALDEARKRRDKATTLDEAWLLGKLVEDVNFGNANARTQALKELVRIKGLGNRVSDIVSDRTKQELFAMDDQQFIRWLLKTLQDKLPPTMQVVLQSTVADVADVADVTDAEANTLKLEQRTCDEYDPDNLRVLHDSDY